MSMTQYKSLLSQYLAQPSGSPPSQDLSDALEREERLILDYPPVGQRKGLIEDVNYTPESYEVRNAPGLSEVFETIREQDWPEILAGPDNASLKPFAWYKYRQRFGSCASAAATNMLVLRREIKGLPEIKLNPLFAYRHVNGGVDGGSSLTANIDHMTTRGTCAESVWGNENGWRPKPPESAYENALRHRFLKIARLRNKEEFGSALLYGLPVYWGYPGHAITGGEGLDRTRFWYLNSWGESWGESGWGTSTYSNIQWGYGAWAILSVTSPNDEV